MPRKNCSGEKQMHLCCRPFRWPCGGIEAINAALPDAACPGLLRKPLDAAAIGRLLAPYRPGGCQDDSKQNKDVICTHFDGRFDGHSYAGVLYPMHRPMEEVLGFHKSHYTPPSGKHSLQYYQLGTPKTVVSFISLWNGLQLTCWPLITIGVWNLKLMRSTNYFSTILCWGS